ncbi:hypothetical protein A0256_14815 [Mucilaginibacter sp. PAMC 26640]|nr:hypothetical protein A0256_14815 [Mucilaginibacter sp. PAMC 26640]
MTTYYTNTQTDTRQYPIAGFWRYFLYISLIGCIGLFCWLGYYVLTDVKSDIPAYVVIPVLILLICGSVYLLVRTHNERLLIETDSFVYMEAYSSRTIYFTDVKGFRLDENYISIIPMTAGLKKIKITKYISSAEELKKYLADNFTNLDLVEYEDQLTGILTDNSLGFTEEDREQKLKHAKLLCDIVNWPSYVVAGLLIFYPAAYLILVTVGVLYPLLAIAVLKCNSLIRFDEEKNSPYPSIALGFIMPLAGLGIRLVSDLSLLNFDSLWLPSGGLFAILVLVLFSGNKSFNFSSGKKIGTSILMMVFVYLYCIAASTAVNCLYDKAQPTEYTVKVTGKNITRGKHTSYHLVLEKWGTQTEGEEESVSSELYDRIQAGDKVTVGCRPGLLGIAWYTVY